MVSISKTEITTGKSPHLHLYPIQFVFPAQTELPLRHFNKTTDALFEHLEVFVVTLLVSSRNLGPSIHRIQGAPYKQMNLSRVHEI